MKLFATRARAKHSGKWGRFARKKIIRLYDNDMCSPFRSGSYRFGRGVCVRSFVCLMSASPNLYKTSIRHKTPPFHVFGQSVIRSGIDIGLCFHQLWCSLLPVVRTAKNIIHLPCSMVHKYTLKVHSVAHENAHAFISDSFPNGHCKHRVITLEQREVLWKFMMIMALLAWNIWMTCFFCLSSCMQKSEPRKTLF